MMKVLKSFYEGSKSYVKGEKESELFTGPMDLKKKEMHNISIVIQPLHGGSSERGK